LCKAKENVIGNLVQNIHDPNVSEFLYRVLENQQAQAWLSQGSLMLHLYSVLASSSPSSASSNSTVGRAFLATRPSIAH